MVKEGYKETIVGEIPEEWKFNPLKEVCKFKNGKSTDYYSNLEEGKYCIYGSNGPIGSLNESNFEKGYIVGRVGAVGEIHYIDEPVWVSDNAIQVSIKKNKKVDRRYLFYWLKRRNLGQFSTKSAQPLLNQSTIKTIPIPFPPLPEQKKIASILSSVDKSIEKTDEVIEKTKELKKGLMQELLTKGIGHSEFKDTILGKIPAKWDIKQLRNICNKVTDGTHNTPKEVNDGYPFITAKNITNGKLDFKDCGYVSEKDHKKIISRSKPEKGDILFTHIGTIGQVVEVNVNFEFSIKNVALFKPDNELIISKYFKYSLQSNIVQGFIKRILQGGVQQYLGLNTLRSFNIPVPPLEEQKKIASILSSVDGKIQKEEEYKTKLERLKKGLMQKLLTGEIRVNTEMEV